MKKYYDIHTYYHLNGNSFFYGGIYSQWYIRDIRFLDLTFNCCEQFMMVGKALVCDDYKIIPKIMDTDSPYEQKMLGKKVKNFTTEKWTKEISMAFVYVGNFLKYTQNEDLKEYLLNDTGIKIVEASPTDGIWGIKMSMDDPMIVNEKYWNGENRLGECIMQVRNYIKDPEAHREYHEGAIKIVMSYYR